MEISLSIPIRDEACTSRGADYYGFAYMDASNRGIERHQFNTKPMLRPDPEAALHLADDHLTNVKGVWSETVDPQERIFAAAATVLRLCMKHTPPQLEVVVNAVADTGEQPLQVFGESIISQENPEKGFVASTTTIVSKTLQREALNHRLLGDQARTIYLPQENFSAMTKPHEVLPVYRGAYTNKVRVALLDTVKRAPVATLPDSQPDHSS